MTKRRRPQPPKQPSPAGNSDPDLPSLIVLEQFTAASLHQWRAGAQRLGALQRSLHFGLEDQRQRAEGQLLESVRSCATRNFAARDWSRMVDYRYSLEPLSTAGSLQGIGGRFNIGASLSPASFTPFPALYCADDYSTAFLEKFGSREEGHEGLTGGELALRAPTSFTQVRLQLEIENVLDISDPVVLKPVVEILKAFQMPKSVPQTARKLGLKQMPWLIRSVGTLQRQLLHPNWRMLPMQFDLPANAQIFGRLVAAAGVHGILYPSVRDSTHRCLALYPQNWSGSSSFVEVLDATPAGVRVTRLDGTNTPQ
jgi:RES domain-containing protein